jgi:hypothetical protein
MQTLKDIWQESLQYKTQAEEYLKSRNLEYCHEIGWLPYLKHNQYTLASCIVIPVFSTNGILTMLEFRTTGDNKQYLKIYRDKDRDIPIFNIHNMLKRRKAVVTEGILNAITFNQLGFKTRAIATLRASMPIIMLHYLALMFDELIFAFDNDEAGLKNYERAKKFYERYYPEIEISFLDYLHNDLNELVERRGKRVARDIISENGVV